MVTATAFVLDVTTCFVVKTTSAVFEGNVGKLGVVLGTDSKVVVAVVLAVVSSIAGVMSRVKAAVVDLSFVPCGEDKIEVLVLRLSDQVVDLVIEGLVFVDVEDVMVIVSASRCSVIAVVA
jgi:hypothetical protein